MMNRKIPLIIVSCVIGLLTAAAYAARIQQLRNEITDLTERNPILVAFRDIEPGEKLQNECLTTSFFTRDQVPKRGISPEDIDLILGRKAFHPIPTGEAILWTDLPEGPRIRKPSEKIPPGYRAISLPADETHTMVHFITPGDYVDIATSDFIDGTGEADTHLIAENIKILCVGQRIDEWSQNGFEGDYPMSVTILTTTKQALKIMQSNQEGELHFLTRGLHLLHDISGSSTTNELMGSVVGQ